MDNNFILAIISPVLITIGGIVTWVIKSKKEELMLQEERARENKIKTYETLLEPFIITFTFSLTDEEKEKGISKMMSVEYRKAAFNLMTFGSDDVVQCYNSIMQAFFTVSSEDFADSKQYAIHMLKLFSSLLIAIRKDLYSKKTKLKKTSMVEFMITDINDYRDQIDN